MNRSERGAVAMMAVVAAGAVVLITRWPGLLAVLLAVLVIILAGLVICLVRLAAGQRWRIEHGIRGRQNWREY